MFNLDVNEKELLIDLVKTELHYIDVESKDGGLEEEERQEMQEKTQKLNNLLDKLKA